MRIWLIYLQNRWRGIAAGGISIVALVALALLGWGGPALGMHLLGNADAPRVITSGAPGSVLPRSSDPNTSPEAISDANASVLDAPAPATAGPQTVAEAQADWSADLIALRQQAVLAELNCARQAQRLPALALNMRLTEAAGAAWLRLAREPSFSLMQLPGAYRLRSVLPLSPGVSPAPTTCATGDFDATAIALSGGARAVGIAVFPPQASWDLPSAVILVQ